MRSIYATTDEYDVELAAREMVAVIKPQLPLSKHTVGILYYDYEMEGVALCSQLQESLGIDILGCSTIATVDNQTGYQDMVATLTILSADDCEFHVGVTEVLNDEDAVEKIHDTFVQTRKKTELLTELVFTILPCGSGVIFNQHTDDLSKMTDGVPIIGGIPTEQETAENAIIFNAKDYSNQGIVLLLSGNIKPILSLANVVETLSNRQETITKAEGTVIYEVEGRSFVDYIESYGMNIREFDKNERRVFFQKYPLLIDAADSNSEDEIPYLRIIGDINWEDGSGNAYASIPEGSKVSLASFRKEGIVKTVEKGLQSLFAQMRDSDQEYSHIFCITCAARHFILNPYYSKEGDLIKKMVPDSYQLSGFYGYGELCPISIEKGHVRNQLHNGSIVFCAI